MSPEHFVMGIKIIIVQGIGITENFKCSGVKQIPNLKAASLEDLEEIPAWLLSAPELLLSFVESKMTASCNSLSESSSSQGYSVFASRCSNGGACNSACAYLLCTDILKLVHCGNLPAKVYVKSINRLVAIVTIRMRTSG
jgi:hypothetical protein